MIKINIFLMFASWSIAFLLFGCAHHQVFFWTHEIEISELNSAAKNYPKVPVDRVVIYTSPKLAPKQYVTLAHLRTAKNGDFLPEEDLFNELKKAASGIGANTVIVLKMIPEEDAMVQVETGTEPANDLGYVSRPHDVGLTVVVPLPTKECPKSKLKSYRVEATAIHYDASWLK